DVAADDALSDHDAAGPLRVDPASGIARAVVADCAVLNLQGPGSAESQGVLHRDGAAGGLRDVAGDDHVLQGQAGVEAVPDGAAADIRRIVARARGTVAVGERGGERKAAGDGEVLQGHGELQGGVVEAEVEVGIDVED